ncbi:MAG TPA: DUF4893 domain-containing protein [Allosphingosinicella sp.]|uniref:DUF4893 domain-containing protein n=1 Tax=Allosphingosinicella sp. TaxID=2823234 RepID=UPI002EDA80B8
MKKALASACVASAFLLSGCGGGAKRPQNAPSLATLDWREIATESDRDRLRQWRSAWVNGLAKASASGHDAALTREGPLLQPDAAIPWQAPPPGNYHCRVLKIGAKAAGMMDYVVYPAFNCRIRPENGLTSFAKLSGSQRPMGLFFPDGNRRMVFLGTLQLGDEKMALEYGRDRERDMAGVLERVGENRWRLVFPYPHFESTIDVVELIPRA